MAFLTFAEAKVVAPPILPWKYPSHTVQIIKGHKSIPYPDVMTQYDVILDPVMMTQYDAILYPAMMTQF